MKVKSRKEKEERLEMSKAGGETRAESRGNREQKRQKRDERRKKAEEARCFLKKIEDLYIHAGRRFAEVQFRRCHTDEKDATFGVR